MPAGTPNAKLDGNNIMMSTMRKKRITIHRTIRIQRARVTATQYPYNLLYKRGFLSMSAMTMMTGVRSKSDVKAMLTILTALSPAIL